MSDEPTPSLTHELGRELFGRDRTGAAMGAFGIVCTMALQGGATRGAAQIVWFLAALSTFLVRWLFASAALRRVDAGGDIDRLLNIECCLCAGSGMAWSLSLLVFDNGALDKNFYLRLLILSAASAFSTAALSAHLRVYFSFAFGLYGTGLVYFAKQGLSADLNSLLACVFVYLGLTSAMAIANHRKLDAAMRNHVENLELSARLQSLLVTERKLREEFGRLARTDELTGLSNRRAVLEQLGVEIARWFRSGAAFSVVALDIDHFKRVNDTRGHAAGDAALRFLRAVLRGQLRSTDVAGRVGGEEFVIGLPGTDIERAQAIAERIRTALERHAVDFEDRPLRFTISCGVAGVQPGDTVDTLLSRADLALYAAKKKGRNCVVLDVRADCQSPLQPVKPAPSP